MGDLAAAAQGMRQVIFTGQQCTCHMEHDDGWELENPIENLFLY